MPKHDPYRQPKRFPVFLDEFLRLVVGGKYKAVRLKQYRKFLVRHIGSCQKLHPSENMPVHDAVEKVLTRDRIQGLDAMWFGIVRGEFLQWIALQRKEKASKAGRASWSQGRR